METILINILPLLFGYLLDLILGDPEKFPHPIKIFGTLIYKGEKFLNKKNRRQLKGTVFTFVLVSITFMMFYFFGEFLSKTHFIPHLIFNIVFVYWGIANQNLIKEGKNVFKALEVSLDNGRKQLSRIVGRETGNLNEQQIRSAVFETMSENLSDGVIAPLFYYAIGGIPALMTYKMINTLDSMIGYRNERYEKFGKAAAILDDIVNYIPARLTAFIMVLVSFSIRGLKFMIRYGHLHKSPNSGYPEAALAGILDCRFGGPNYYHGLLVDKPYIGINGREIHSKEIKKVIRINQFATLFCVCVILFLKLFF